jgi:hypothetical protein
LELVDGCEFSLGEHHGKNMIKIPITPSKFILAKYIAPIAHGKNYLKKSSPEEIKKYVLENLSVDRHNFDKLGLITIYSYLMNSLLKTFFHYEWSQSIKFPLSRYTTRWKS